MQLRTAFQIEFGDRPEWIDELGLPDLMGRKSAMEYREQERIARDAALQTTIRNAPHFTRTDKKPFDVRDFVPWEITADEVNSDRYYQRQEAAAAEQVRLLLVRLRTEERRGTPEAAHAHARRFAESRKGIDRARVLKAVQRARPGYFDLEAMRLLEMMETVLSA